MMFFSLTLLSACARGPQMPMPQTLAPAPSTPNCVHSAADPSDTQHAIEPIRYTGDADVMWARLNEVVLAMPRVRLADEGTDYRHYIFTTRLMRFKDDVQFQLNRDESVIHFRSASRIGREDFGVNRRRMEEIRAAITSE